MSAIAPEVDEGLVEVQLPSGAMLPVYEREVDHFNSLVNRYLSDNHFVNVSDMMDVDRMLMSELLVYRWNVWLARGRDYFGDNVDSNDLQKAIKEHSAELRQLKKMLGIDKVARDKQRGDDSPAAFIEALKRRAKEFGVMRERQLGKALELFQQLNALITLYMNCDDVERREMHVTQDDVIEWVRMIAIPEFEAIDSYFREHQQRFWIREL